MRRQSLDVARLETFETVKRLDARAGAHKTQRSPYLHTQTLKSADLRQLALSYAFVAADNTFVALELRQP